MRIIKFLFIAAFVLLLWAPLIKTVTSTEEQTLTSENRKRHPAPVMRMNLASVSAFPSNFDGYYQDVFGYRERLIKKNQRLKMQMGMSISENVIRGKEGWYFFAGDELMNDYRGLTPYSAEQVELFRLAMEQKQAWLKQQGIAYLFVLTPNKVSIYPEYMSDKYPKVTPLTHADQLVPYLHSHSDVNFLDLRPALLEAKKYERIYHRVDTHWNDRGAYVGYREIIANLQQQFPELQATALEQFDKTEGVGPSGDLGLLMGAQSEIPEEYLNLQPKFNRCATIEPYTIESVKDHPNRHNVVFATRCPERKLKVLMFRDSFTMMLQPLLSESFYQVIYINKPYNHADAQEVIAREKPDLLIEQSVERHVGLSDEIARYSTARYAQEAQAYGQLLSEITSPAQLLGKEGMEIVTAPSGVAVVTDSQSANFIVYEAAGERLLMTLDVEAPQETYLRVQYQVREADGKLVDAVRDIALEAGANEAYVDMRAFPVEGPVRVSPGIIPGRYHLKAITIRGAS